MNMKLKPDMRKDIQSTFSGIHDPLGFVSPFILHGKIILERLFEENVKWDETVPKSFQKHCEEWKRNNCQKSKATDVLLPREARKSSIAVSVIFQMLVTKVIAK